MRSFIIVVVSLTVALASAELALRSFSPIYTVGIQDSYEYDSLLGVKLRKNVDEKRMTDHLEEIHTNRFGVVDYRNDYGGYPTLAFAIGDSYTQGTGLPSDMSYPALLDQSINRDSAGFFRKRVAVVNLGLGSYGAEQSLRALQTMGSAIGKPAWCLYLGSDNDYDDDLLFQSGSRHRQLVKGTPRWRGFAKPLASLSSLQLVLRVKLALAERRLKSLRESRARAAPQANLAPNVASPISTPAPKAKTVAELEWPVIERIMRTCSSMGARTILSWVPSIDMSLYDWMKGRSAADSIPFNDWYPRVSSTIDAIPSLPVRNSHSGGHYRGWVSAQIAAGFQAEISKLGLVVSGHQW